MNTTSSGYGKTNGSHRCSCCPYGYHIDVDFVQYCEALISALYGKRCPSSTSSRGSLSLHRPPKRRILTSTVSLPSDDQTYQWLIDQNYNKSNGNTNGHANRHHANSQQQHIYGSPSPHHFNSVAFLARLRPVSNSSSRVNDILNPPSPVDKSLTDAVELFEQVLKEHEANVASTPSSPLGLSTTPRRSSFPRINGDPTLSPSSPYNRISESLPTSPAPSSTSNNQNNYNNNHSNNNAHNGVNKAFLSQFRDQLAISVQKMKDLEQQVKDIPVLRQKILLLQAERKRLLKQIKGDTNNLTDSSIDADGLEYYDINSPLNASRIEELEKSGLITPPMTRRKFLIKDSKEESVEELRSLPSRISNLSPVSCKNITLEDTLYRLRDGFTQTDLPVKIQVKVKDASTTISNSLPGSPTKKARKPPIPSKSELVLNKVTSISIRPTSLAPRPSLPPPPSPAGPAGTTVQSAEPLVLSSTSTTPQSTPSTPTQYPSSSPISVGQPKVYRSIGVSTNIAPSLPRRSFASSKESEVKKYQQEEDPKQQKPSAALPSQLLMSRGTDPLTLEVREAVVQVSPKTLHASVGTDYFSLRETGINCDYKKDLGIRGSSRSSQTERPKEILRSDKIIQVNEKCSHCELKQMETIGVGNDSVYPPPMTETGINTEQISSKMVDSMISSFSSMASSIQSIKLCDKCNETITNLAREVVKDKTPSPVMGSRIPRLSAPPLPPSSQPPLQANLPASTASATTITTIPSPSSSIPPMAISLPLKTTNLSNKIIIEEGNDDEILVYRNPNINLGSRKHRSNFPSMMTPQVDLEGIRLLDEACKITDSESEDAEEESFSSSEGTYILDNDTSSPNRLKEMVEPSKELRAALKVLNDSLSKPDRSNKPATAKSLQIVEKEWFSIAACKDSDPSVIEVYLDCFESFSAHLLNKIVNLTDSSGNTAMHYAISHSNFDVVSVLLDSKVCDVNKQNKAGYTAIMLVSTARVTNETQKEVIRRLFSLGDVNIRAKQNGQTALMLASSHGQFTTCKLLLEAGAALNVQDNDGSTALMCATEHGHVDVVKLLLSHPDCDPTIADNDKSTAMTIAMECGRKDIAVLLYASCNMFGRGSSPYASLRRSQSKAITTQLQRTGSFTSHSNSGNRAFQLAPSPPTRSRHPSTNSSHSRSRK